MEMLFQTSFPLTLLFSLLLFFSGLVPPSCQPDSCPIATIAAHALEQSPTDGMHSISQAAGQPANLALHQSKIEPTNIQKTKGDPHLPVIP